MHIDELNWNDLKFFLALSREGSLSAAGRRLDVKHTTVARRILALEEHLGTRLFDRSRSGYAMTQAAEDLFEQVVALEENILSIDRQGTGRDAALSGPLKLTIAHELANRLIIPELGAFCRMYPGIDLCLLMTKDLMNLGTMEADLAIRMTPNPPEDLVGRELMPMGHGIYGTKKIVTEFTESNQSDSVDIILFEDETTPPDWVTRHFKRFNVIMRVDDVGSMAVAAAQGVGFAKLPCFIGETEAGLQKLDLDLPASAWGIWLLYHADLRTTARVRACREFIEHTLAQKRSIIQGGSADRTR
ncbi:LysR family transcriptional regulator [Oceanospirillum sediminis]|uniref:LysR family transcriptional regulator n=1 Tax=Oceanospirillum sediminis TaxID=2760088 RepID=A0A839IW85_9GAMM|nr:LysR family transcriptional regulator [Oceanospirillum sediminis]MBB1489231.1 LysR family transcriptional regulator [Oceanospirillum sediminis]